MIRIFCLFIASFCFSACTAAWYFVVKNDNQETVVVSFGEVTKEIAPGRSAKIRIVWEGFVESLETKELIVREKGKVIAHQNGSSLCNAAKKAAYPNVYLRITGDQIEVSQK